MKKVVIIGVALISASLAVSAYTYHSSCGRPVMTIDREQYAGDDEEWKDYLAVLEDMMCGENPIPPGQ